MRANRKSVKLLLLEMACKGRPRPHAATNLYAALHWHLKTNHAFRSRMMEVRPDWIPVSRDAAAPIKTTRHTGTKYRQTIEEMALMGEDRPKATTPEGRALYHLCRTNADFKAWIMQETQWDVRSRAEKSQVLTQNSR